MTIIGFNDWDDAARRMAEAERVANESVADRQREIVYGSYWLRAAPDGMLEYGRVLDQAEGERDQEPDTIEAMRDTYQRGYRFSWQASVLGVAFGDAHIAVLWPITEEEFEQAQAQNWELTYADWQTDMLRRVTAEMREAQEAKLATHPNPDSPQEGS